MVSNPLFKERTFVVTRAVAGDEQAQQSLKDMAVQAAVTLTNIPAAVQTQLDAANAAEAAGDPRKAAEIRAELITNGLLIVVPMAKGIPKVAKTVTTGVAEVVEDLKVAGAKAETPTASNEVPKPINPGQDFAMVNGIKVTPLKYGEVYHGTDNATLGLPSNLSAEQVAQKLYSEGLPARGNNIDLIQHAIDNAPDRAFRGTTVEPLSQNKDSGAVLWAGEGGLVIEFKNVKGYDVNQALEGRVPTLGGFGGNPKYGEQEIAVPGAITPSQIGRVGVVKILDDGTMRIEWIEKK